MSDPAIIVIGPEGSGTTLVWECIVAHPQLRHRPALPTPWRGRPIPVEDVILHLSLPTLRPMRWVHGADIPSGVRVVAVRRSPLHTVYSAYRRFYREPRRAWRTYLRATACEAGWLAHHQPLCLAYEDLVHNSAAVLRRLYEFLGVDGGFAPPIALTDRNDERWRTDARFAAFMRRAFGGDATPEAPDGPDAAGEMVRLDCTLHGTRVVVEDASGAGIATALRAALPPGDAAPGDAPPVRTYTVDRRGAIYRVRLHGEVCLRRRAVAPIVAWLRGEIDTAVAEHARRSLFVHAGVVGWRGRAVVIPGRTHTGKSHLVCELVRRGATYYSDEFAVFDERGRVWPYARRPVLRDGVAPPDDIAHTASRPLPLGAIVSTSYRAGAAWRPRTVRGVRAVVPLIDNTILARHEPARLLRLGARLAPHAVTLQGARPDAAAVAPRLLAQLDALFAGGDAPSALHAVAARAEALREAAALPDEILAPRYLRLDDLLDPETHARLLAFADARAADFAASGVVSGGGRSRVDPAYRRSLTVYDLGEIWPLLEPRLRRLLPFVRRELGLPWFPPGPVERQLTAHGEGDFFRRHSDNGSRELSARRLTCVYYFHRQPRRFRGGELRLYERLVRGTRLAPGERHVTLDAADNSAVFFASHVPHEVAPVTLDSADFGDRRFSLTIWFRAGAAPDCVRAAADPAPAFAALPRAC